MSTKFVRLQADVELAINLENVAYIIKGENVTFVHFLGSENSLPLTGEVADSFWRSIVPISLRVHHRYVENQGEARALVQE